MKKVQSLHGIQATRFVYPNYFWMVDSIIHTTICVGTSACAGTGFSDVKVSSLGQAKLGLATLGEAKLGFFRLGKAGLDLSNHRKCMVYFKRQVYNCANKVGACKRNKKTSDLRISFAEIAHTKTKLKLMDNMLKLC